MAPPTLAVIPSRFAATRFPGKPLADLDGRPMIVRVAEAVARSRAVDRIVVATDDARIEAVVRDAGFTVLRTAKNHASGSDRVAEAVRRERDPVGLVVNVQGDEPLLDPRDLDALIALGHRCPDAVTTLVRVEADPERARDPNVVKVVVDGEGRALYFSRGVVPYGAATPLVHVGLYAYPPDVLARFAALPPSPLERAERLEQLRALEHGVPIFTTSCVSERPSIGVDTPEDAERVTRELRRRAAEQGNRNVPQAS